MSSITEYTLLIRQKISEIYDNTIGRLINTFIRKPASILFLGIDNAGKTTLVNKLKNNTNHVFLPTKHAKKEVIEIGNLRALIFDIGGHRAVRMAWKDYFCDIKGVVFIVDTGDRTRFNEVREAWAGVNELAKDLPILVIMNKIDLLGESVESIRTKDHLKQQLEESVGIFSSQSNVDVVYLSVVHQDVYNKNSEIYKGFEKLGSKIDQNYKKTNN